MKNTHWEQLTSHRLLEGRPGLVALSKQLILIDRCWRKLLSLPMDPAAIVQGRYPCSALIWVYSGIQLALDVIRTKHPKALRRSIANTVGPKGPTRQLSGIFAYVDLGEHTLTTLQQIREGRDAAPISNRYTRRVARNVVTWKPIMYTNTLKWAHEELKPELLDELAVGAIQDLVRLRRAVGPTPQEVKEIEDLKLAKSKLLKRNGDLTDDAVSILRQLPNHPCTRKLVTLEGLVSFRQRKLKSLLRHVQTIGFAEHKKGCGYYITDFGRAHLRRQTEPFRSRFPGQ
jgi:hypothetical protein